jgi:hypothetical protein
VTRREAAVVVLVALAALSVVNIANPQDISRLGLTQALARDGSVRIDRYASGSFDKAVYAGHTYSDKAPGMSFLALVPYEAERAAGQPLPAQTSSWHREGDLRVWAIRLLTGGLAFLAAVLLVGREANRIVRGTGAAVAATFGLATLAQPFAPTTFGHLAAGVLAFGGFLLARAGRRPATLACAGLAAGVAVLVDYPAALIAFVILLVVARRGWRPPLAFLAGAVPPALALAAYDRAAFGSPFHVSYRYVANALAERQHRGFFGIALPSPHSLGTVLAGDRGLLVASPVLVAAVAGLVLLWRRRETRDLAAVGAAVTVLFLLSTSGYFLPYGGESPGPRFFVPALPFLALGLAPAFARWPRTTMALAVVSAVAITASALVWGLAPESAWSGSIWSMLREAGWRIVRGHSIGGTRLDVYSAKTIWTWLGVNRLVGDLLVVAAAAGALTLGLARLPANRGG